jgi:fibronectin type 3 domain-containing protein
VISEVLPLSQIRLKAFLSVLAFLSIASCDIGSVAPEPPRSPSGLIATPRHSGQVQLTWQDNGGSSSEFRLEDRRSPNSIWNRLEKVPSSTKSYLHSDLKAGNTYSYRVQACNNEGCSEFSNEAVATVLGPVPPSALAASSQKSGQIRLTWKDDSDDESSFKIESRKAPSSDWNHLDEVALGVTQYLHLDRKAGDTYTYRVRSCNASGCSEYSNEAAATVITAMPPSNLVAEAVVSGRLELTWQDNSDDESSFQIESRTAPSTDWNFLVATAPNVRTFAHLELKAGRTITYRVTACNGAGCSTPSNEAIATVIAPRAPSDLIAQPTLARQVDLAWKDNSQDEATFEIEFRENTSVTWSSLATAGPDITTYAHTQATAGKTLVYRLRACAAAGCSSYSNEASGVVGSTDRLAIPTPIEPANESTVATTVPVFSWTSVTGARAYRLMVAKSSSALPLTVGTIDCTDCVINVETSGTYYVASEKLAPGTTYYWQISARVDAVNSEWSQKRSFVTSP